MNLFDSSGVYSIPFKEDSDGAADTTSDSDTALNLASAKHRSVAFTDTPGPENHQVFNSYLFYLYPPTTLTRAALRPCHIFHDF